MYTFLIFQEFYPLYNRVITKMRSRREVEGGNIDVWKLQYRIWNESIPTAVSTESVEPNGTAI